MKLIWVLDFLGSPCIWTNNTQSVHSQQQKIITNRTSSKVLFVSVWDRIPKIYKNFVLHTDLQVKEC